MDNFDFHLGSRIHFGRGKVSCLKDEVLGYGTRVFFVYDEIPVKASGLYDQIIQVFRDNGISYAEFTGAEPNPRYQTVDKGVAALKQSGADCIVVAGGGSTIDCGKAISFGAYHDGSVWDFYCGKATIEKVMPVIAIPTLAASGAEVSFSAVLSNMEEKRKIGLRNGKIRPAVAIMDPQFTFSVPPFHTACGIVDIMSHTYETYFAHGDGAVQDGISEAIMYACVQNGRKVMDIPTDYDARAQLMWAAALSIAQISSCGRENRYTIVHTLEHMLSAYYDVVHGAGIAILSIAWFKYALNEKTAHKFARWGRNVWDIAPGMSDLETGRQAIAKFESFCQELGLPTRLSGLRGMTITEENITELVNDLYTTIDGSSWFRPVTTKQDLLSIFKLAL